MGFAPQFTARTESSNGVARIALTGELDMATVPLLKEQFEHVEQNGFTGIVLDLRDLTFVDSSGLHAFVDAHSRAKTNGHRLILVGAGPSARKLFELSNTQFLLDEQEAVGLLNQFTGSGARRVADSASSGRAARA